MSCQSAGSEEPQGHKTDDKDGWWLAHLLRHAMIYPSFIPPGPFVNCAI